MSLADMLEESFTLFTRLPFERTRIGKGGTLVAVLQHELLVEAVDCVGFEVHEFADDRCAVLVHHDEVLARLLGLFVGLCGGVDTDELALLVQQSDVLEDLEILVEFEVFGLEQCAHFPHLIVAELVHFELHVRKEQPGEEQASRQH